MQPTLDKMFQVSENVSPFKTASCRWNGLMNSQKNWASWISRKNVWSDMASFLRWIELLISATKSTLHDVIKILFLIVKLNGYLSATTDGNRVLRTQTFHVCLPTHNDIRSAICSDPQGSISDGNMTRDRRRGNLFAACLGLNYSLGQAWKNNMTTLSL